MDEKSSARIFRSVQSSANDIARAKALPVQSCPRRYCWWWHTLSFDWDVPVSEGCRFTTVEKPPDWPKEKSSCKRADPSSSRDFFEPREPHLIEDGVVPIWFFHFD